MGGKEQIGKDFRTGQDRMGLMGHMARVGGGFYIRKISNISHDTNTNCHWVEWEYRNARSCFFYISFLFDYSKSRKSTRQRKRKRLI